MGAELRWILLGLSLPLLAGIWWWTARRHSQTPGKAELREPSAATPVPPLDPRYLDAEDMEDMGAAPQSRDWGVPPFEPLSIRTAEFEQVPVLDGPMMVHLAVTPASTSDATTESRPVPTAMPVFAAPAATTEQLPVPTVMPVVAAPATPTAPTASAEPATGAGHTAAPPAHAAELQKIVTIRVCAAGEARWPGAELMAALELHGLAFGRYQVFHRKHTDGRSLFCVASLIEPGTFNIDAMADQEFRGVTLFAVLPGPIPPVETMDELFRTARGLAEQLSAMVQDGKGMPLSPQRAASLREEVARFQASLPWN